MKHMIMKMLMLALIVPLAGVSASAEIIPYERDVDYTSFIKYDRFLYPEVWTDDDEYYEGDNITISFRTNEDCYVAIYNVDSRGRVHLLYPTGKYDEPFVEGDRIYTIPNRYDDYDLTIQGPEGMEFVQIVASRNPIFIPDWYNGSGLVCDDDPYDFIDYVNATYFNCDHNCRRAFDITSFVVKEWHNYYFRPVHVYEHHYHNDYWDRPYWDWGFYGAVYIDYPFGATVYIDGVYWGIAPLFIPRIYYGAHYVTVYDRYGYCWEDRVTVTRRKSIVLDNTLIKTKSTVKSRFKEVQKKGYLDPVKNGYPEYDKQVRTKKTYKPVASQSVSGSRYKIAQEKSVNNTYGSRYKTGASVSGSKSDRQSGYSTSKRTSQDKSRYKNSEPRDNRSSGYKSSGSSRSKRTPKYESDRYRSQDKSSESRKSRSTDKSSKSGRSYKSSGSSNSGESGKSSGSSRLKSSGSSGKSSGSSSRKSSGGSSYRGKSSSSGSTSARSGVSSKSSSSRSGVSKRGR